MMLHAILITLAVTTASMTAQLPADLTGHWVREGSAQPGLDDVVPAWEDIALVDDTLTIRRAIRPTQTEVYRSDSTERPITRVRSSRYCRTAWSGTTLLIDCRELDGGPGGAAPEIATREARSLDSSGRLVLVTTWRSGDRTVTRRAVFRKELP